MIKFIQIPKRCHICNDTPIFKTIDVQSFKFNMCYTCYDSLRRVILNDVDEAWREYEGIIIDPNI